MATCYFGHFSFDTEAICQSAPDDVGIYYCGNLNPSGQLIPHYIGRAKGHETSIRSRLLDHVRSESWANVTHFGFRVCISASEASELEQQEIANFNPCHNTQGRTDIIALAEALLGKRRSTSTP